MSKGATSPQFGGSVPVLVFAVFYFLRTQWGRIKRRWRKRRAAKAAAKLPTAMKKLDKKKKNTPTPITESLREHKFPMEIRFTDLTYRVGDYTILGGVSGCFKPGRVTCIFGGSGAGKTSLLQVLLGRPSAGSVISGDVTVNGRALPLSTFAPVLGFVPQADICHADLTVRENFEFAARMRLPSSISRSGCQDSVQRTIDLLRLGVCENSIVGDENRRGISGGQKKRVNIGLELVAEPTLLVLDEPTSGLDASSTLLVFQGLQKMAERGLTVISIIHQPRIELFSELDDLLLLGAGRKGMGGKVFYMGPAAMATPYLKSLGFAPMAPETSPPDFILDVTTGTTMPSDIRPAEEAGYSAAWLGDVWENDPDPHRSGPPPDWRQIMGGKWTQEKKPERRQRLESLTDVSQDILPDSSGVYFARALVMFTRRSLLQLSRDQKGVFIRFVMTYIAALVIGVLLKTSTHSQSYGMGSIYSLAVTLMQVLGSLSLFGAEALEHRREMLSNYGQISYALGKFLADVPMLVTTPVLTVLVFFPTAAPRMEVWELYLLTLALGWASSGIGYFISLVAKPNNALLTGVITVLVAHMFSGANPTLADARLDEDAGFLFASNFSPSRWSSEAYFLLDNVEVTGKRVDAQLDAFLLTVGYRITNLGADVRNLVLLGLLYRLAAIIAMLRRDQVSKRSL